MSSLGSLCADNSLSANNENCFWVPFLNEPADCGAMELFIRSEMVNLTWHDLLDLR